MTVKFDWQKYETTLATCIERAVLGVMQDYPDEAFYAVALHEFYREEGEVITMPCLAVNTEEELDGDEDRRWSSADWYWIALDYASKALERLHDRLNAEARRLGVEHWRQVHELMMQSMIRVAKQLTARLRKQKQATKDFGVYLFDQGDAEYEIGLLRKCMTAAKFKQLFPNLEEILKQQTVESNSPLDKKLALYKEDLFEHGDELISHGRAAIPILLDALDDPDQGWKAPLLLGKLGIADKQVIHALRKRAGQPGKTRAHETGALALLGDIDFLLGWAKQSKTREIAVHGIKSLYSSLADECLSHVTLDYRPIERLLEIKSCRKLAEKDYGFGRGPFVIALQRRDIQAQDVDEAVRGTHSRYRIIREHAVRCLGNPRLGRAVGERAMEAIEDRFTDRAMNVRRLAAISIQFWKKAAKPALPALRRMMRNDPDPDVRYVARCSIREIG